MTPQGPPPPGGGPDDHVGEGGFDPADDGPEQTGPRTRTRGWLPPDDRLWRHPSELLSGAGSTGAGDRWPPRPAGTPRHRRRGSVATTLVGSAAAASVAVGVLLLMSSSMASGPGPLAGGGTRPVTTLTVVTGCCRVVPSAERDASRALVSLQVSTARGVAEDCGVVVAGGGLVATTLDAVAGATTVTAVTASGRRVPATVVAGDPTSDIAILRVAADLPVASFAGDPFTAATRRAVVLAMSSSDTVGSGPTATMWATGTIRSVTTVARGNASGMAGIEAATGPTPDMAGEVLLEPDGRVLGILDRTGSPSGESSTRIFLPSQLVVGVADALAASGEVDHGWLDIEGADAPTRQSSTTTGVRPARTTASTTIAEVRQDPGGAMVLTVERGGAAAGVLRPGDVIRSLDGHPIGSMAELRDRLYVLPPGTRVMLGIVRDGVARTVAIALSPSP